MIDQGKISELKQSSHCYQTSKSVGQMAATFVPQAFLKISGKEEPACERPKISQASNATRRRKERRWRAKQRYQEALRASMPQGTESDPDAYFAALYPKQAAMKRDASRRKEIRADRHECYMHFRHAYAATRGIHIRRDPQYHAVFCSFYKDEPLELFSVTAEKLSQFDTVAFANGDLQGPTVNLSAFPNASSVEAMRTVVAESVNRTPSSLLTPTLANAAERMRRIKALDDYTPQSGTISSPCTQAVNTSVKVCVQEVADASLPNLTDLCSRAKEVVLGLEQKYELTMFVLVAFSTYFTYRILTDLTLLITWMCGFVSSSAWRKSRKKQQRYDSWRPQSQRLSKLQKFRDMAPQAGILNSDDGAAFKGTKPKNTKPSPKKIPSKTPVTSSPSPTKEELIPWTGMCAFGGAPRPKKDQSKHNGFLNGFGVGL